jgi:hypothetical protein
MVEGVKLLFPSWAKNTLATASGTKVYLVEEKTGRQIYEFNGVTQVGLPSTGADGVLQVTLTLPLFEVSYAPIEDESLRRMAEKFALAKAQ